MQGPNRTNTNISTRWHNYLQEGQQVFLARWTLDIRLLSWYLLSKVLERGSGRAYNTAGTAWHRLLSCSRRTMWPLSHAFVSFLLYVYTNKRINVSHTDTLYILTQDGFYYLIRCVTYACMYLNYNLFRDIFLEIIHITTISLISAGRMWNRNSYSVWIFQLFTLFSVIIETFCCSVYYVDVLYGTS